MLAAKERLPSFNQFMDQLRMPDDQAVPHTWRAAPVSGDDSDARSQASSRASHKSSASATSSPKQQHAAVRKASQSPPNRASRSPGSRATPLEGSSIRQSRFAPYSTSRPAHMPSINVDKANTKPIEKAEPTPPISLSLRRANRPQPLALTPRNPNHPDREDIAPAPISALLRSQHTASASAHTPGAHGAHPRTSSPRISGYAHGAPAPRSPMYPLTPVSIPTLPMGMPISPMRTHFGSTDAHGQGGQMSVSPNPSAAKLEPTEPAVKMEQDQ